VRRRVGEARRLPRRTRLATSHRGSRGRASQRVPRQTAGVAAPLRRCPKSAAELMSTRRQPHASLRSGHLNCPRCGLSIAVRPHRTAIRHCPRCVGRSRVLVELFSSALPADVLYEEGSLPQVDGETAFSGDTSASAKDPHPAERRRAQVVDKLRRAEPLPLATNRPMAVSLPAIGERAASFPRSRPRLATCPSCPPAGRAGRAARRACPTAS